MLTASAGEYWLFHEGTMNHRTLRKYLACLGFLLCFQHGHAVGQTRTNTNIEAAKSNLANAEAELNRSNVVSVEPGAESKQADIRKLISVTGSENLIKQTLPKMIAQMRQAMPQVPNDVWREIESPGTAKELIELYVPIYEKHFTHAEIKGMLDFYDTPLGNKIVTTMPVVLQESMDAGNKWGVELGNRVKQRWSAQGLNQSAQNSSTPRRPLTDQEKQRLLRANGYDPNSHELDDDGNVYERSKTDQKPVQLENKPVTFPSDVRFIIHFSNASGGNTTYFSKEEPKPFGNGFRFRAYPTDTEVTVSGNVQITRIPMKNTPGK